MSWPFPRIYFSNFWHYILYLLNITGKDNQLCLIDIACGDNQNKDSVNYEKNTENGEFSPDKEWCHEIHIGVVNHMLNPP